MDTTVLRKAGLSESQAKGYLALIEHGALTPTKLASLISESRTNGYMICEKLEKLGLATRKDNGKALFLPAHPSALEALAERRRKVVIANETAVKQGISPLLDMFYASNELPGARTLQGIDGIKEVFDDVIRTRSDVYFIRTTADVQTFPDKFYTKHRSDRHLTGITTYALTPVSERSIRNYTSGNDKQYGFHRTFYPADAYTAPVEIQAYGPKVALIAYGETQMATIINSPPLAEAMRQIFKLLSIQLSEYSDTVKREHHFAESLS